MERPGQRPFEEVSRWARERVFEPDEPIKVVVIERGRPAVPLPIDRARELYLTGNQPQILVDGFARGLRTTNPWKVVSMPAQLATDIL